MFLILYVLVTYKKDIITRYFNNLKYNEDYSTDSASPETQLHISESTHMEEMSFNINITRTFEL